MCRDIFIKKTTKKKLEKMQCDKHSAPMQAFSGWRFYCQNYGSFLR